MRTLQLITLIALLLSHGSAEAQQKSVARLP
jgi:hypothetical protein